MAGCAWLASLALGQEVKPVGGGAAAVVEAPPADVLVEDFEKKNAPWTFEGKAFQGYGGGDYWSPGRYDRGFLRIRGYRGRYLLKTWGSHGHRVDEETGRAVSSEFKLERRYLRFLLSGGRAPGRTCLNLLVDGEVKRSAIGSNTTFLEPMAFDLRGLQNRSARLEVVDRETGPWGHVCLDEVTLTNDLDGARVVNAPGPGGSDVVWTRDGRLTGAFSWADGKLKMEGRQFAFERMKSLNRQVTEIPSSSPHAVRFRNGERWRVEIRSASATKLKLYSRTFGEREVDLASVAAVEFSPETEPPSGARPGVLYRTKGRPLPGKLIWIKDKDVGVDCPLGVIPMPREGLLSYAFTMDPARPASAEGLDEVGLADGGVLRGKAKPTEDGLSLQREELGEARVSWSNVSYFLRGDGAVQWLADLEATESETIGPLGKGDGVAKLDLREDSSPFLSALRVTPNTVMRYRVSPSAPGSERRLRAVLAPVPGCRGDATFSLTAGGKEVFRSEVNPDSSARDLALFLPAGEDLVLKVAFGERLAYPCGVELRDAHVDGLKSEAGAP